MRQKFFLVILIFVAFAAAYLGKRALRDQESNIPGDMAANDSQDHAHLVNRRIVSLAPSITEILFALGLGDRVVGVTRYCDYPPEALTRTKVGGYYDPSYETIIALNSDLVIMLPEHEEPKRSLGELDLSILVVNHNSISGILNSITAIGKACGAEQKAASIVRDLRARMERISRKTDGLPRSRIMISLGRNMGSGALEDVYISGKEGFYSEMITLAGGVNAYDGDVAFPVVSAEGITRLNPDVIIDMITDLDEMSWNEAMILKEWETVSGVDAVGNNRVYVFGGGYVVIPGPRFILIIEEMARVMHPEVDWE